MQTCNILLTSLGNLGNRLSHKYYYFEEDGVIRYCDGISVGEAGAKYIMSHNTMDEIVVIGSGATYNHGEEGVRIPLRNFSGYRANNIDTLSEYGFFLYRLLQFQRSLDLEGIDVLEQIEDDRKKEIIESYEAFCTEFLDAHPSYTKDNMFHYLAQDGELVNDMYSKLPSLTRHEIRWLKRYVFTSLSDELRLTSLDVNNELKISFIPSDKNEGAKFEGGDNIIRILQSIYKSEDVKVNLYVDMQGLGSSSGYSILAILSMISNDANYNIEIKEIITSHQSKDSFADPIDNNEMGRYEINKLISGMEAFLKYGKVSIIENYWQETGIKNDHIDRLINAMRWVDDGISLSNIEDLEYGIELLKEVFKEPFMGELPEFESNVFQVLERGIRMDYGPLLDGDELDCLALVKWAFRKKFYQQCITIIESRIPNELVSRGICYYMRNEEDKERFMKYINIDYWDVLPRLRYSFKDLSHHYIKLHGRNLARHERSDDPSRAFLNVRMRSMEDPSTPLAGMFSIIDDHKDDLEKLLYSYYTLGNVRNSINHAERKAMTDAAVKNERMELVINTILEFIQLYEHVNDLIAEKGMQDFKAQTVTYDEFRKYTYDHRIFGGGRGGRGGNGRDQGRPRPSNIMIPNPKLNPGEKLIITVEIQTADGEIKKVN